MKSVPHGINSMQLWWSYWKFGAIRMWNWCTRVFHWNPYPYTVPILNWRQIVNRIIPEATPNSTHFQFCQCKQPSVQSSNLFSLLVLHALVCSSFSLFDLDNHYTCTWPLFLVQRFFLEISIHMRIFILHICGAKGKKGMKMNCLPLHIHL